MLSKSHILFMLIASVASIAVLGCGETTEAPRTETDNRTEAAEGPQALPRMVELYSNGCGVCKKMKPVVEGLVAQCDNKGVRVESIDVSDEDNEQLMDHYQVRAVPTFLFLDEYGMEVARLVGEQSEQSLKQALSVLRGEQCPGMTLVEKPDFHKGAAKGG